MEAEEECPYIGKYLSTQTLFSPSWLVIKSLQWPKPILWCKCSFLMMMFLKQEAPASTFLHSALGPRLLDSKSLPSQGPVSQLIVLLSTERHSRVLGFVKHFELQLCVKGATQMQIFCHQNLNDYVFSPSPISMFFINQIFFDICYLSIWYFLAY